MGAFIEQVQRNNQLQNTILSARQQKELEKARERRKKEKIKEYKDNVTATKSGYRVELYNVLKENYKKHSKEIAFAINEDEEEEIINDLIRTHFVGLNEADKDKLFFDMIQNFSTLNKRLYTQAKTSEKIRSDIEPVVEEEEETVKTSSKVIKVILIAAGIIIVAAFQFACGFIGGLAGMNGGKRRRF